MDNLELVNNELINTINKKGLMKNCKDFKDKESITLINPNIFKEAHEVNSIDILIDIDILPAINDGDSHYGV